MKARILFFIALAIGCSTTTLSENKISESTFTLHGGVYKGQRWSDELDFNRQSYYRGATLLYDVLWTKIDHKNPFSSWLGGDSHHLNDCENLYIGLLYSNRFSLRNANMPRAILRDEIKKSGLREVVLNDFKNSLVQHYNYNNSQLFYHKTYGFCQDRGRTISEVGINVPGYQTLKITL